MKNKNNKPSRKEYGRYLYDLREAKIFKVVQIALTMKAKIDNWDYIKI